MNNYKNLALTYKNEKVLNDGLTESSRLKVEICNVVFTKTNKKYTNIFINIFFGNEKQKTNELKDTRNLIWNEQFEFKVNNGKEKFYLEICATDLNSNSSEVLGRVNLPLDEKFPTQDEYVLDIGIPDEMSNNNIATISTKIQFIRSYKQYYDDLAINSEKNKESLEQSLRESQKLFENLNEPFGFFSQLNNSSEFKKI